MLLHQSPYQQFIIYFQLVHPGVDVIYLFLIVLELEFLNQIINIYDWVLRVDHLIDDRLVAILFFVVYPSINRVV